MSIAASNRTLCDQKGHPFMVCWSAPPHQEQQPKHEIHIEYMIPFSPPIKKKRALFSIYIPELFTHKKGLYGTLWDAIRSYGPLLTFCSRLIKHNFQFIFQ